MSADALDFFLDEFDDDFLSFAYIVGVLECDFDDIDTEQSITVFRFILDPARVEFVHEIGLTREDLMDYSASGDNMHLELIRQIAAECSDSEGAELIMWGRVIKQAYENFLADVENF